MPEGPEVKIAASQLTHLLDNVLQKIEIVSGPYKENDKIKYKKIRDSYKNLESLELIKITTKGKFLCWHFRNPETNIKTFLGFHLGLTGRFLKNEKSHTRFIFRFKGSNDPKIYFDDVRNFAQLVIMDSRKMEKKLALIGPDIFFTTPQQFQKAFEVKRLQNKPVAVVLKDQRIVSGIGNYMRADAFYIAKLPPKIIVSAMSNSQFNTLFNALKKVYNDVLKKDGTISYKGNYKYKVYKQKTAPDGRIVKTTKFTKSGQTFYHV